MSTENQPANMETTLTVDLLKKLPLKLRTHLNGGSKFSTRIDSNDEWGLFVATHTDGSPHYRILEKKMGVDGNEELSLDLMKPDRDFAGFCQRYNEWRIASPNELPKAQTQREEEIEQMVRAVDRAKEDRAAKMPDEKAALGTLFEAYQRLTELGWRNAIYCPKDRTQFKVIEAGSAGVHDCIYDGEWPNGTWWILADGDMYPSRPILFKPNASA